MRFSEIIRLGDFSILQTPQNARKNSLQISLRSASSQFIQSTPDARKVQRPQTVNIGVGFKCHQRINFFECALP